MNNNKAIIILCDINSDYFTDKEKYTAILKLLNKRNHLFEVFKRSILIDVIAWLADKDLRGLRKDEN